MFPVPRSPAAHSFIQLSIESTPPPSTTLESSGRGPKFSLPPSLLCFVSQCDFAARFGILILVVACETHHTASVLVITVQLAVGRVKQAKHHEDDEGFIFMAGNCIRRHDLDDDDDGVSVQGRPGQSTDTPQQQAVIIIGGGISPGAAGESKVRRVNSSYTCIMHT